VPATAIIVPLTSLKPALDEDLRALREDLAADDSEAVPRDNRDVLLTLDRSRADSLGRSLVATMNCATPVPLAR